jgi:hypothetical protein
VPPGKRTKNLTVSDYSPQMAQQFLFAVGWDKYKDRYFARADVQKGIAAFNPARPGH